MGKFFLFSGKSFATKTGISGLMILWLLCVSPFPAAGQMVDKKQSTEALLNEKISLEMFAGYIQGESRELVYNIPSGRKISELFWKIDQALVLGGTLAVKPMEGVSVKIGGWVPVTSSNSMNDYDWLNSANQGWDQWSNHPNTRMGDTYSFDAGLEITLFSLGKTRAFDGARINFMAGYQWQHFSWTDYGGTYIYTPDEGRGPFRSQTGAFPSGEPGIAYDQWFEMPYLGLSADLSKGRWFLSAAFKGTLWGKANDRDFHYRRLTLFQENYVNVPMVAFTFDLGYALTKNWSLIGKFGYQKIFETKASTQLTNYSTGESVSHPGDAAGLDNYTLLISLGLNFKF